MRRRIAVALAAGLVVALAGGPQAGAQVDNSLITTSLTGSVGTRVITAVGTLAGDLLDLDITEGITVNEATGATYAVLVTEALKTGNNPWHVNAELCAPDGASYDCGENYLVHTSDLAEENPRTIPGSAFGVSNREAARVLGGGTVDPSGTYTNLGTSINVFENTGQSPSVLYTGQYIGSGNLTVTPPDGTETGAYTGFFVVTLGP